MIAPLWAALLASAMSAAPVSDAAPCSPAQHAVASIGNRCLTSVEVDGRLRDRLMLLREEEYRLRKAVLDDLIAETLLGLEAERRGVTVDELTEAEVTARVSEVGMEEIQRRYGEPGVPMTIQADPDTLRAVASSIRNEKLASAREALLQRLRAQTPVRVWLEPPRAAVSPGRGVDRGPANAPLTIIEFSDFECPYSRAMAQLLDRLEQAYQGRVRRVFRHFPLPIHENAIRAAEAVTCAREQGRFWEMHDNVFQAQTRLDAATLRQLAVASGLEMERYAACVASSTISDWWKEDRADGEAYGVSGTPTLFVNGRVLAGSQPYRRLIEVVEDELARAGAVVNRTVGP